MTAPLGKLERIPLRKAWAHEAGEFTPWLAQAENLTLLAESLGLGECAGACRLHGACVGAGGQAAGHVWLSQSGRPAFAD